MTDPVTNLEIEDVLSSIRRLVSENSRAERPAEPRDEALPVETRDVGAGDAEASDDAVHNAQMLVLTPALRVSEEERDAPGGSDKIEEQDASDAAAREALEEAVDGAIDEAALELAIEDAVHDAVEAAVSDNASDDLSTEAVPDETGAHDVADAPEFTHVADDGDGGELSTLEDRIAGLEAAVAERDDNWDPDGISDDDNAGAPVEALRWEDSDLSLKGWEQDPEPEVSEAELIAEDVAESAIEPDAEPEPEPAIDLSAFVAPAEEAGTEAGQENDPLGHDTGSAAFAAKADSLESDARFDDDPDTGADADLFGAEDAVIDEDMLRDMVSEIVRRELQGSLGERITRNVRKLVRREIHRALAARELD